MKSLSKRTEVLLDGNIIRVSDEDSGVALYARLEQVSIDPEANTHVWIVDEVHASTTRNVEVTIDLVVVLVHNCSSATKSINVDICTVGVVTSGRKHSELNKVNSRDKSVSCLPS